MRLTVFGRLLACMPAKKPSISLSKAGLKTAAPELDAPDLTEFRPLIRPFPKDAGERACYQYVVEQMQASPDRPRETKAEFEKACRRRFHVKVTASITAGARPLRSPAPVGISPGAAHAKYFLAKPTRGFFQI